MVRSSQHITPRTYIASAAWLGVAVLLFQNGLGDLAVILTILLAIVAFGLRDAWAGDTSPSAYAVFNENGRALAGDTTAQDLDQQLRSGGASHPESGSSTFATRRRMVLGDGKTNSKNTISDPERLRRRQAAAAAADKRQQQKQEEQSSART